MKFLLIVLASILFSITGFDVTSAEATVLCQRKVSKKRAKWNPRLGKKLKVFQVDCPGGWEEIYSLEDLNTLIKSNIKIEKGDTGDMGPVGPQGLKGDKGDKGESGVAGLTGPEGPQGLKGEKGDSGERGATGPQGLKGEKGEQGIPGLTGPEGPRGLKGEKGDSGEIGATGPQGLKGEKGEQGIRGLTGPEGPRGLKGEKGDSGETGATGPQGLKGEKGDKGEQGVAGPAGSFNPFSCTARVAVSEGSGDQTYEVFCEEGEFVLNYWYQFDSDKARIGKVEPITVKDGNITPFPVGATIVSHSVGGIYQSEVTLICCPVTSE